MHQRIYFNLLSLQNSLKNILSFTLCSGWDPLPLDWPQSHCIQSLVFRCHQWPVCLPGHRWLLEGHRVWRDTRRSYLPQTTWLVWIWNPYKINSNTCYVSSFSKFLLIVEPLVYKTFFLDRENWDTENFLSNTFFWCCSYKLWWWRTCCTLIQWQYQFLFSFCTVFNKYNLANKSFFLWKQDLSF